MNRQKVSRITLAALLSLFLIFLMATTSYGSPEFDHVTPPPCPTGEVWDPILHRCVVPLRPCPAGTIDINGNGRDDGGEDCQNVDEVAHPASCVPGPLGGSLPSQEGYVECILPLSIGATPLSVGNSAGCLDILRAPFPRAMARLEEPTKFNIVGFIPPERLGYPDGAPGSYRVGARPWTTTGQFLHERWGWWTYDSSGLPAFSTNAIRPASDPYWYPSINNLRAYLLFSLNTYPNAVMWSVDGLPAFDERGGFAGDPVEIRFIRSSFPLPGQDSTYSRYGPSRTGANDLPAFKMRVRTRWQLYLVAEWDNYGVNGTNEYVFTGHESYTVPVGAAYISYRVWDSRQSITNTGQAFCNAADGHVPVPVIEAQAVIRQ